MIAVRHLFGLTLLALVTALSGCAKDTSVPVKGTVTLNGSPLEEGRIEMSPSDGIGTTAGADIHDGEYELRTAAGPKKVQITAQKVVGKAKIYPNDPASPEHDVIEQLIPANYNTQTELKCDIKAAGNDDVSFELKTGGASSG